MNKTKTALKFFKEIEHEQDRYRLVNGLFIVKYLDEEISVYVGEFEKSGSALNTGTTNKVRLINTAHKFNKSKNLRLNVFGNCWKKLDIAFIEKPIKEILK